MNFTDLLPELIALIINKLDDVSLTIFCFVNRYIRLTYLSQINKISKNKLCREISRNGNVDLLIWARQNGCLWDEYTCTFAALNNHLSLLKYAVHNGCPHFDNLYRIALRGRYAEMLKWLDTIN